MKSKIRLYVIDNIKKRRLDNEWSQRYLGDCLNVSQGFIQKIENPKSDKSYNIDHLINNPLHPFLDSTSLDIS